MYHTWSYSPVAQFSPQAICFGEWDIALVSGETIFDHGKGSPVLGIGDDMFGTAFKVLASAWPYYGITLPEKQ